MNTDHSPRRDDTSSESIFEDQWVIWNGSLGILDTVTIGELEVRGRALQAWLDEPYDMVGPFDFRELRTSGRVAFAACLIMSRQRWQEDQVALRRESITLRRQAQERLYEELASAGQRRDQGRQQEYQSSLHNQQRQYRAVLELSATGEIQISEVKAAFRRLAQKHHPDVGGSHEHFVRLTQARDALLAMLA